MSSQGRKLGDRAELSLEDRSLGKLAWMAVAQNEKWSKKEVRVFERDVFRSMASNVNAT